MHVDGFSLMFGVLVRGGKSTQINYLSRSSVTVHKLHFTQVAVGRTERATHMQVHVHVPACTRMHMHTHK